MNGMLDSVQAPSYLLQIWTTNANGRHARGDGGDTGARRFVASSRTSYSFRRAHLILTAPRSFHRAGAEATAARLTLS